MKLILQSKTEKGKGIILGYYELFVKFKDKGLNVELDLEPEAKEEAVG